LIRSDGCDSGVVEGEIAGQLAVGADLGEEILWHDFAVQAAISNVLEKIG